MLQDDSKLCVYNSVNAVKRDAYQTKKHHPGSGHKLIVADDGQLNIIDTSGNVVWESQ